MVPELPRSGIRAGCFQQTVSMYRGAVMLALAPGHAPGILGCIEDAGRLHPKSSSPHGRDCIGRCNPDSVTLGLGPHSIFTAIPIGPVIERVPRLLRELFQNA